MESGLNIPCAFPFCFLSSWSRPHRGEVNPCGTLLCLGTGIGILVDFHFCPPVDWLVAEGEGETTEWG